MGNCVFRGFGVMEVEEMIKVETTDGGIMELYAPITAGCITNEFPGHAIYRSRDLISPPLLHNEELQAGNVYYLLPLNTSKMNSIFNKNNSMNSSFSSSTLNSSSKVAPYRMSFDNQRAVKRSTAEAEVFPRYNSSGVWKVKLVICPEYLSDILAQEARTEELIENLRTVAKNGNGASSSVANSDQLSVGVASN